MGISWDIYQFTNLIGETWAWTGVDLKMGDKENGNFAMASLKTSFFTVFRALRRQSP
jgi:hypothetical protein